jgi:hypothetical protein
MENVQQVLALVVVITVVNLFILTTAVNKPQHYLKIFLTMLSLTTICLVSLFLKYSIWNLVLMSNISAFTFAMLFALPMAFVSVEEQKLNIRVYGQTLQCAYGGLFFVFNTIMFIIIR